MSWDEEHHLSTGSVKFGLLAEMLKTQGRITTYEQVQTRLDNQRNEANIIKRVVMLLDAINEETVYNKLSAAWDAVTGLKREKDQSLNDFFSKFKTIQYSLNLSDDMYKDPKPVEAGKDINYYELREKMSLRRVKMNDELKSVQLIKALGVDDAHKRDILAKVDFNKEPNEVYEDTKTAIRDICGDKPRDQSENNILVVKPWQEEQPGRNTKGDKSSRSRSWDRSRGDKFRDRSNSFSRNGKYRDRSNSYSREGRGRDRSRERYSSRERSRDRSRDRSGGRSHNSRRSSVSFQERNRGERRETTPGPGTLETTSFSVEYDKIFNNDDIRGKFNEFGQFMIVDSGCPRSLMGDKEYI